MLYPKFIIEDGNLIIGKCKFHRELAKNETNVIGGGWFRYEDETKTFIFSGESHDFGRAKIEDIKSCIENEKVFTDRRLRRNVSNHKFMYDTQSELIPLN